MTPAIERAAQAAFLALAGQPNVLITQDGAERAVRAVLQSLLPPTEEMIEAGASVTLEWCTKRDRIAGSDATAIFTAMINTALGE